MAMFVATMQRGLLLSLLIVVITVITTGAADGSPSSHDAMMEHDLRALYDATGGDEWFRNEGWRQSSMQEPNGNRSKDHWCTWFGISCRSSRGGAGTDTHCWNSHDGCVITTIDLSGNNLRGVLPLHALCRPGSAFAGVRVLNLSHNLLQGGSVVFHVYHQGTDGVPLLLDDTSQCSAASDASILSSLVELDVSYNRLNASLRWFLHRSRGGVRMPNLRVLLARGNRLRDVILDSHPPLLSDSASTRLLPALEVFDIGSNCVLGQFPTQTFAHHTPRLRVLKLDNNFLVDGTLSWLHTTAVDGGQEHWGTTLVVLHLHNNYIQSTIPASVSKLLNLQELVLDGNRIYGTIPRELQALRHLRTLSLAHNYLRGQVPCHDWFTVHSPFASLTFVDLTDNELDGSACEVAPEHPLQVLRLADNALSGVLPPIRGRALTEVTLGGENRWACELPAATAIPNWVDAAPSTKCLVAVGTGSDRGSGTVPGDANAAPSAQGSWWRFGLFGSGRRAAAAAAARQARIQEEGAASLGPAALHAFSAFLVMVVVVPISLAVITAAGVHLPAAQCIAPRRFLQFIRYEPSDDDVSERSSASESEEAHDADESVVADDAHPQREGGGR